MKKLNNKGFAISTLLYGLMLVAFLIVSLLMSIMSTNRKNTSTLIKKIEEELNRYSQTTTELSSTEGSQEFIVPYGKAGWYKIELWGAAAKNVDAVHETEAGRGAYTSGIIYLEENTHLYFQIGTVGGTAGTKNNTDRANGGGATDVRLVGGNWNNSDGLNSRIMVAAGGSYVSGGLNTQNLGTGYGGYYTYASDGGSYISGYAGLPAHATYKFISTMMVSGVNAGAGKAKIELVSTQTRDNPPAKKTQFLNGVRYITDCIKYTTSQTKELWREIVAIDSTGTNVALGKTVTYGTSSTITSSTQTVTGFTDGDLGRVSTTKTSSLPLTGGYYDVCIKVDLGTNYNLEEIVTFHNNPDPGYSIPTATYSKSSITVSGSGGTKTVQSTNDNIYTPTETYMGVRFSDRNPDVIPPDTIPTGNYYIQSALADNRFVTVSAGTGRSELFTGNNNQRWSITLVGTDQYKILDGANQMAFQPTEGGLEVGESVSIPTTYQEHAWEKWKITTAGANGYYLLQNQSGQNLCLATTKTNRNESGPLQLRTCNSSDKTQWFKFINADY